MSREFYASTHTGNIRSRNEDAHTLAVRPDGSYLLIVADGMGGMPNGALASALAVEIFRHEPHASAHTCEQLLAGVLSAQKRILDEITRNPHLDGMGTTITAVVIGLAHAHWVHVGDSRLYLLRNNSLTQLSKDHRFISSLLEDGDITPEQASTHKLRHVLDQCLGCPEITPDQGSVPVYAGDIFLLCTDGLYEELSAFDLQTVLESPLTLKEKTRQLIDRALSEGGRDNVTVIVGMLHS